MKLPQDYKGYSVNELLHVWEQVQGDGIPEDTPKEKILAMRDLLREYRLGEHEHATPLPKK